MTKRKKNYTLKIFKDGKLVSKLSTHSIRRFTTHLRTINWVESMSACLRISYGTAKGKNGELTTFSNECRCANKKELLEMFEYFKNETIWDSS